MDDLIAWLRVQLDDDERETRKLLVEARQPSYDWPDVERLCAERLADIDAKRRILDEHAVIEPPYGWAGWCSRCVDGDEVWDAATKSPCPTVRLLALPYADRPGYRPEWKP